MFSLGVSKRICLCRNRRHMWRVLVYILFVEITRGKVRVPCCLSSLYVVMFCTYTYAIVGRRWIDYFYFAWHLPNEKMHYMSPFISHSLLQCIMMCWPHERIRSPRYIEKHLPEMKGRLSLPQHHVLCGDRFTQSCYTVMLYSA